jgi:hypothetical protein
MELLEDETEGLATDLGEEALRQARDLAAVHEHPAGGGFGHGADDAEQRGLARPARPLEDRDLARLDQQAHVLQRRELVRPVAVEDLRYVLQLDHGAAFGGARSGQTALGASAFASGILEERSALGKYSSFSLV